jgi:peptidoglycan glycosyltransferase
MNAETGEIISMVSQPTYEAAQLDEIWSELITNADTPLLNRVVQGRYQPGTVLGPFLLAALFAEDSFQLNEIGPTLISDPEIECALPGIESTWSDVISAGCKGSVITLGDELGGERFSKLLEDLGFFTDITLDPGDEGEYSPTAIRSPEELIIGQSDFRVSPLQVARAVSALSAGGAVPEPQLVAAVNLPDSGWMVFPTAGENQEIFSDINANKLAELLADEALPIWQVVSKTENSEDQEISWYLAGTLPGWSGAPLIMVIVLEDDSPQQVLQIGREMMEAALQIE